MLLWILLALMTGAAVLAVLVPLSVRRVVAVESGETRFYRDQLAEIDRDREKGLIGEPEAAAARAEAGRRLLRAADTAPSPVDLASEPAYRRRRTASALAISVIPIVALAVYGAMGAPHLATSLVLGGNAPGQAPTDLNSALARIESHLATNPGDAKGWDLVAPIYLRTGRPEDAASAYAAARRAGGETPERLMGFGEAKVAAAQGVVSAEAREAFARGVELEPNSPRGRFYLALASEQDGDAAGARSRYQALIAEAPPGAPYLPLIRARLAALSGEGGAAPPGGVAPESVSPDMIRGMVDGLDARLLAQGGSEAEWARLVRSLVVMQRRPEALDRLGRAKASLAGDPEATRRLEELSGELGLGAGQAAR